MLSSVLRSPRAVAVNISIMRAFVRYRETLMMNAGLAEKFWRLEGKVDRHDKEIGGIMDAIRGMIEGPRKRKGAIGFRPWAPGGRRALDGTSFAAKPMA